MTTKQNGRAHLSSDIDFIQTPEAPVDTLSTGRNPGVPLTNVCLSRPSYAIADKKLLPL